MAKPKRVSVMLVIPSEIKLVDLVHQASEKVAELVGFDDEEALNFGLAVREAVINAIVHGNGRDPERRVRVAFSTSERSLSAKIRDEGEGFEADETPDPTAEPHLLRTSGRGLLLMRAFVDRITFRHPRRGGMEVTLAKRLPSSGV